MYESDSRSLTLTAKKSEDFQMLNHSLEVLEIRPFKHFLEREGENFIEQHYTSLERSVTYTGERRIQYLAGRYAAKSALAKCLAISEIASILSQNYKRTGFWLDIEILRLPTGQPSVALFGQCQSIEAKLGIKNWLLSISHTANYAVASTIAIV